MSFVESLKAWAAKNTAFIFAILRFVKPNLVFKQFALITRFKDVQEALSRPDTLGVTYAEKMSVITDGSNFFLGMDNTPVYTRDVSNMRITIRRDDVDSIVAPLVEKKSIEIVQAAPSEIDVVTDLSSVVPCQLTADYLGIPGPSQQEIFQWCSSMFQYLFFPDNPKQVDDEAIAHSAKARAYLDNLISQRQQQPDKDDVIGRCLELQKSHTPGMSNLEIRNNLIGIIIGLLPTTSKCVVLVIDYLLDHPELLAQAQQAALSDDNEMLRKFTLECLRFNSFGAGVFRIAKQDYKVASGTFRSTKIPAGSKILVATQSAMLDGRELKKPKSFRLDRPDYHYMHFGYGMHTCFGQYINMVQIPLIVKSLLLCKNLRRSSGEPGQVVYQGPFPIHLHLEFDQFLKPINKQQNPEQNRKLVKPEMA